MADITCVDYLHMETKHGRFAVVYQFYSFKYGDRIRLKAFVADDDPRIDSLVPLWQTANWLEREVFDMFGIVFRDHPDLRRILMPEDWEGHPLRKDYPVKGPDKEHEWQGYKEVLEKAEKFKEFQWNR